MQMIELHERIDLAYLTKKASYGKHQYKIDDGLVKVTD